MGLLIWTFKRRIDDLTQDKVDFLLTILDEELKSLKVDIININDNKLIFKNSFFNGQGRNHLMSSVDSGEIFIDIKEGELVYKVSVKRMFLILCGMCAFLILVSWNASNELPVFLFVPWLVGMNLLSARIRHSRFSSKLENIISVQVKEFSNRSL